MGLRHTPDSFWRRIRKGSGCWLWTGATNKAGYGIVNYQRAFWLAHRLARLLSSGVIPEGIKVLHRCDNPPCCNPDHLFLGTQADNVADMKAKGRASSVKPKGEQNGQSKLTADEVLAIRKAVRDGESQGSVARRMGLVQPNVSMICSRKTWAHLPPE